MSRAIALYTESFPERAAYDTAVSRALLHAAARGDAGESLRLHLPPDVVAFSVLDRARPGFREAVAAARAGGWDAILRLAGGRAAVFHRETIAFAWCIPDPEPRGSIARRFDWIAAAVARALQSLGVDARVGAVPGEYCPGDHSVNARGARKLMGVGQRLVREQPVREQNRLGVLQMRVAGHGCGGIFCAGEQRADKLGERGAQLGGGAANPHAKFGYDQFVAAAAGVQLAAGFAGKFADVHFDEVVHVFGVGCGEPCRFGVRALFNGVKRSEDFGELVA